LYQQSSSSTQAGQAVWQSLFIPDPFGLSMQYVGLGNFKYLLSDPYYRASFFTTGLFSILVTLVSMIPALFLAIVADRLIKGAGTYRTMLIWPVRCRSGYRRRSLVIHV
jgi:sn-glycerol 3-phosphate transport system permease protein